MTFLNRWWTAPLAMVLMYAGIVLLGSCWTPEQVYYYTADWNIIDIITLTGYGVAVFSFFAFQTDFKSPKERGAFWGLIFLTLVCVLRELGAQHWLTTTDTTAFKGKFFLNPNNPLSEKIQAGLILGVIVGFILYFMIRYTKAIVLGFFKKRPLSWTVCCLGAAVIIAKFFDRFPGHYRKAMGMKLNLETMSLFSLAEEMGEILLPLLIALGVYQYHLLKRQNNQ